MAGRRSAAPFIQAWAAALLFLALGSSAFAGTHGWLRFADGNRVSGQLIESGPQGGLFRSDRFGDIRFAPGEALFEPAAAAANEPPAPAPKAPEEPVARWQPKDWSIGLSGYWKRDNGGVANDIALDLDSTWKSPGTELKLNLSADYKTVDKAVDNNEQAGSLRWLKDLRAPWFMLGSVNARRSDFTIDPQPALDYLLLQSTFGLGLRKSWSEQEQTLLALGYNRVMVNLLNRDRRIYTGATSLLVENQLRLWPRVTFHNTLNLYLWRDGSTGIDSLADLNYQVSERLSVGLRHEYRRNAINFDLGSFNRLSLTTRFGF